MQYTDRMSEHDRKTFVEGLKKYQRKGIPVYIDNRRVDGSQLERILEHSPQGYYMADFVLEENPDFSEQEMIREDSPGYEAGPAACRFRLKEIRFDKVYYAGYRRK